MKVLLLTQNDWAGWGYKARAALELVGHDARMIDYGRDFYTAYPHDIHRPTPQQLGEWIDWADVLMAFDSGDMLIPVDRDWKPVLQVFHGSWYRARPEKISERAKRRGYVTACTTHDLTKWGATWLPVAVEDMSASWAPGEEFTVVHAPTKRSARGTEEVIQACEKAGAALDLIENVSNSECLERKARGHLYIDQAKSGMGISYGVNSVEAWALGMPVINHSGAEVRKTIKETCGEVPFRSAQSLAAGIKAMCDRPSVYEEWKLRGRKHWARFHEPKAAASYYVAALERAQAEAHEPEPLAVSVCMIVRNEEECLQTALDSTKGLADEVVVVDTGSEDKTVEIAEAFGAKVILGGDRMNKGGSRNQAIENATGDWVVILDADEKIAAPEMVREHIQRTYADGMMPSLSYMAGDKAGLSFNQQRCWVRNSFRYRYHAHELPLPVGKGVTTEHVPYVWEHRPPGDRWGWKTEYTLRRILLDVEEYPDDPRPLYYLGRQYLYMLGVKKYADQVDDLAGKAKDALHQYITMLGERMAWDLPTAYGDLGRLYEREKDVPRQLWALHNACRVQPSNRRWWMELARAYWESGARDIGLALAKVALAVPVERQQGYRYPALDGWQIFDRMSLWCWHMGKDQEGREYAKEAVARTRVEDKELKRILGNIGHFDRRMKN